ncbi:MAG: hypothetical protein ACTH2Q_07025 [Propionibacteriaceae bacterium]
MCSALIRSYAGWMSSKTTKSALKHEALELSMRSFRKVISA